MRKLGKLFGTDARVKLMRLFLFNPEHAYDLSDMVAKTQISERQGRAEIKTLNEAGFIKPRIFFKEIKTVEKHKNKKVAVIKKKKVKGYILDESFEYLDPLRNLLIDITLLNHEEIVKRLRVTGVLKAIIVSGLFVQNFDGRIDILVIGDSIKKQSLDNTVKKLESEIGKELRYSYLSVEDFKYRKSIGDKLVRDIFDYPHKIIFDRIDIE